MNAPAPSSARELPVEITAAGVPEVAPAWLAARATGPDAPLVVDVRGPHEWNDELGHIDGARLVPLSSLPAAASHWRHDTPIVAVCRSGGRSGNAALWLLRAGFREVASLRGGMLAWNDARLPVAR